MDALIRLDNVCYSAQTCLRYPNICIEQGKTTFLQGPSGAGKSTLFKLLNATLTPYSGTIFYQGQDIATLDTITLRREILLVNQRLYLFARSIRDNFNLFYHYLDKIPLSDDEIKPYLALTQALDFGLDNDCSHLSGGEQQRVFLAIALSLKPKLIMLDEPTSALDERLAKRVMGDILAFCQQEIITPLIISHDDNIVQHFAQNIIAIHKETA
ncbi:ABC transporter ATP-binding protein [Pasteurellaceae bacterium HPA106]|uniref:ABC transporter ATP-binding protein n=1 Tax=Spirabiliibacterium pneumoniae TaxID=221400 RepID=UPI001AAD4EEA|nr:ABC transporter ATP-binding protein [Spirabiliibacterium pneumoniae]MBE2896908.1 ABC transporter ATP-binding protein [Spirabiliibacterium pneumoniae]